MIGIIKGVSFHGDGLSIRKSEVETGTSEKEPKATKFIWKGEEQERPIVGN